MRWESSSSWFQYKSRSIWCENRNAQKHSRIDRNTWENWLFLFLISSHTISHANTHQNARKSIFKFIHKRSSYESFYVNLIFLFFFLENTKTKILPWEDELWINIYFFTDDESIRNSCFICSWKTKFMRLWLD